MSIAKGGNDMIYGPAFNGTRMEQTKLHETVVETYNGTRWETNWYEILRPRFLRKPEEDKSLSIWQPIQSMLIESEF